MMLSGMKASELLRTVRAESRPVDGHIDPNALNECWDELAYLIDKMEA